MALFDAQVPNEEKERRRKLRMIAVTVIVVVVSFTAYSFRYWNEERAVDRFFQAIEQQNFEQAYALWMADPDWRQHAGKYRGYPYGRFELDWGPSGEWGSIRTHKIEGSVSPKKKPGVRVSGVVVVVTINERAEPACLWVEKDTKSISFSPVECHK